MRSNSVNFLLYYQNVHSLRGKMGDFLCGVSGMDYDFIAISET